jgi:putative hemolysin
VPFLFVLSLKRHQSDMPLQRRLIIVACMVDQHSGGHMQTIAELDARTRREPQATRPAPRYRLKLAENAQEIEAAQRLRYQIFFEDAGRHPANQPHALDVDEYDADCEHLIVIEETRGAVVGCYRIMRPEAALRRGTSYADREFDLSRLRSLRGTTVEAGRACIHPDHRAGSVIMLLWSGLARFMIENRYQMLMGCASMDLSAGHDHAAAICRHMLRNHLAPHAYRVKPHFPFNYREFGGVEPIGGVRVPPLLKGYTRAGAWICGEPAFDADFNSADLFVLMPMSRMPAAYAKHFIGGLDQAA